MKSLLVLNTGSSSVKFRLFEQRETLPLLAGGKVVDIGGRAQFSASLDGREPERQDLGGTANHETALQAVIDWLGRQTQNWDISTVAHRVVHGGTRYTQATKLTDEDLDYLETLVPLAPLHQPHNLAGIRILSQYRTRLVQYGCFDTAFHARHDPVFSNYAIPRKLRDQGVRRYGFHGLSYDWVAHCLRQDYPDLAQGRVVVAHLGNGSSLCAMKNGQSWDTTMGMTALDGLPMGTRCGAIDPGAVLYMQRSLGLSVDDVDRLLNEESGLLGLSGVSNDVKTLMASPQPEAQFALTYFETKAAQNIAAMAAAIGGMDALIFTGGIGENAESIRNAIVDRLSFFPPFKVVTIAANEERSMAQEVWDTFGQNKGDDR